MFRRTCLIFFVVLFTLTTGNVQAVVVSDVGGLQTAINNANSGGDKTILLADGEYDLSYIALQITANGVTVRGQSGNRASVILDNHYREGGTSGIFRILASDVTIADMTLRRPYYHAIHISPGSVGNVENTLIDNVHIIDPGEQAIKINPDSPVSATQTVNNGIIQNCLIELTNDGRTNLTSDYPCYTGGIDGHWAANWVVQDNVVQGFWCSDALSEHGIHFWNNSSNILVERNQIIDCDRGIGFGLGDQGNSGGIIRNNMIYHGPDHGQSDVGISLESTPDADVYNNTIFHEHGYSAIEYRFASTTNAYIANNLTNRDITLRDGASATVENNVTSAQSAWFVNTGNGDLHLASSISSVVDQGLAISGLVDDFDRGVRPYGGGYDIGADEYGSGAPPPPPPPPVVPEGINMAPVLHLLGDRAERAILKEDFESWPPSDWTVVNNGGDCVWGQSGLPASPNYTGGLGEAASADADDCGSSTTMNTELITPVFDLSMAESATLTYKSSYNDSPSGTGDNADFAEVDISTDGGTTWTNLLRWDSIDHDDHGPGESVTIDLTPYSGSIMTMIRFHYFAPEWDWWWMVDDVTVTRK